MALTQAARMHGPSWDEEVVPALRKRLESESRTLARRMSAISLSSVEDPTGANFAFQPDPSTKQSHNSTQQQQVVSNTRVQRIPLYAADQVTALTPRVNGTATPTTSTNFQRARTYSTPYASDYPNGRANGDAKPKNTTTKSPDPTRSLSPRPADVKPTRIPIATRQPLNLPSNSSHANNYSHAGYVTPSAWSPTPEFGGKQKVVVPSSSSQTLELSSRTNRQVPGLLTETAPFPTDTTFSSGFSQPVASHSTSLDLIDPPRSSMESEERPYEHWYRGEVSRNGGVGELRVGRRQEMLDIANYGHMVRKMQDRQQVEEAVHLPRRRAGSIAGITNQVRERNSLVLEDEYVDHTGMVLDETPLTDMDGEDSEARSSTDQYMGAAYAYSPEEADVDFPPSQRWTTVAGAHEMARSITPTQSSASQIPRPSSRSQTPSSIPPPSRIPGPSSRRSSITQATPTNTQAAAAAANNSQNPPQRQPPHSNPSSLQSRQQPRQPQSASGTSNQKRHASPAQKRMAAAKLAKSKTLPANNRGSVAYYPTPDGDGEDMADAIPSWTQPVARQGNWDDVVLPVVARKKGLDGYENADGSPKPKRTVNPIEPAPGTFGFDHSKYRPPRVNGESIPMDEFGRQDKDDDTNTDSKRRGEGSDEFQEMRLHPNTTSAHDATQLPVRQGLSPSPAPFSNYPANSVEVRHPDKGTQEQNTLESKGKASAKKPHPDKMDDEDGGSGCCKCVVM